MQDTENFNDLEKIQEGLNGLDRLEEILGTKFRESQVVYLFYKSQLTVLEAERVMLKRAAQQLRADGTTVESTSTSDKDENDRDRD